MGLAAKVLVLLFVEFAALLMMAAIYRAFQRRMGEDMQPKLANRVYTDTPPLFRSVTKLDQIIGEVEDHLCVLDTDLCYPVLLSVGLKGGREAIHWRTLDPVADPAVFQALRHHIDERSQTIVAYVKARADSGVLL